MSRNLIVMCDGTNNQVSGDNTNVLKLFRILDKTSDQRAFYDPGIGTIGDLNAWTVFKQKFWSVIGLMTGYGLDDNILAGYRFLVENWQEGDRIFLFGFSRGAYTVRALAGFIHLVGLLSPDQSNIADYALMAYKSASDGSKFGDAMRFGKIMDSRRVSIHFVGVWDTVASVLVPRWDRLPPISTQTLPYTRKNPSVQVFRHAIAVDERRRMFRVNHWAAGQMFKPLGDEAGVPQDIRQLWFAGVHSDVGGGYPEKESGLAKIPLIWMIEEAVAHGLTINTALFDHLARGEPIAGGSKHYVAPDPCGPIHRSLHGAWWILEWIPKSVRSREWPKRWSLFGYYLPRAEPREISAGSDISPSVVERQKGVPDYHPPNIP